MKKFTASLVAFAALTSTAALADTPVVRDMNTYDNILKVAMKNRMQGGASEFVIYHQDSRHPCPPEKGKKHPHEHEKAKDDGHKHHHHHHDDGKDAKKVDKVKKSPKKTDEKDTSGETSK